MFHLYRFSVRLSFYNASSYFRTSFPVVFPKLASGSIYIYIHTPVHISELVFILVFTKIGIRAFHHHSVATITVQRCKVTAAISGSAKQRSFLLASEIPLQVSMITYSTNLLTSHCFQKSQNLGFRFFLLNHGSIGWLHGKTLDPQTCGNINILVSHFVETKGFFWSSIPDQKSKMEMVHGIVTFFP